MNKNIIIVDTNILFSALQSEFSIGRKILKSASSYDFYSPNYVLLEIYKYKEVIHAKSKASDEKIYKTLEKLLETVTFINEQFISTENYFKAYHLCKNIDKDDMAFVALTLEFNGLLWTKDIELKTGLKANGFNQFFEPPFSKQNK